MELVQRSLAAIEATQPTLNAFRCVRAEAALAEAEEADRRLAAGERAPLLGVPVAIKDDVDLAGETTEFGCRGRVRAQARQDAEAVRRLKAAGAVIVGKTTTPELGQWPITEGTAFGVTRNPWSLGHTPGGSSGGSAAAVAAGLVAGALGSDGLGSIRIPAAWTHLVGIKPQRGRISTWPDREAFNGLACIGPLARTVADAALLLDAAAGNHAGDAHCPPSPGEPFAAAARARAAPAPDRRRAQAALHAVRPRAAEPGGRTGDPPPRRCSGRPRPRRAGCRAALRRVRPRRAPALDRGRQRLGAASARADSARSPHSPQRPRRPASRRPGAPRRPCARGTDAVADVTIFTRFDVVLTPTTAQPPLPVGAIDRLSDWETDKLMIAFCPYTWPWNVLGWPGVNVPAGLTDDGLPLGAQLLGPAGSELELISLAAALEDAERWHERRPPNTVHPRPTQSREIPPDADRP